MFSDELKFDLDFHDRWPRLWHRTGERYQPPAMIAHDRYGGGSVMAWGGITIGSHDWENRTPHLSGECRWALLQRQCHWAYCCVPRPLARECIHLSRRRCKSPLCTCCPRSPGLLQNHDPPIASKVSRPVSS